MAEDTRDAQAHEPDWHLTRTWERIFSKIEWRNKTQAQRVRDEIDGLRYTVKKRLQREGTIRRGR